MSRPALTMLVAVASILAAPVSASAQDGTSYAFLVGCSSYDRTQLRPLPSPINDVEEFKKALLGTGFEADHIKMLHDKQGDRRFLSEKAKILKELALLLEGIRPNDTLVVALSGHGVHFKGDRTGYFCPVDAKLNDKNTLIAMEGPGGLFDLLKNCKARRKLLIVNACRNDPSSDLAQAANKVNLDDEDGDQVPEGIAAIYSCKQGQKSYYDDRRNLGIFFDHVIRSWKGEYLRGDNELTLESFFDQVITKTKTDVDKTLGESQIPVVRREYTGGAWLLSETRKLPPGEMAFRQGFRLRYGLDMKPDLVAALEFFREASRVGHAFATAEVAGFSHTGDGGQVRDRAGSRRIGATVLPEITRLARSGDGLGQYYLAMNALLGVVGDANAKEAVAGLKSAVDKKIVPAMTTMAQLHLDGDMVPKDPAEALRLYQRAAELGSPEGHRGLGHLYEDGIGVARDTARAFREYQIAAEMNWPSGQSALGRCYSTGSGVPADPQKAVEWYQKAADQKDNRARTRLGLIYAAGAGGVARNQDEAVKLFRLAADQNDPFGQTNLGIAYRFGNGVPRDYKAALDLFTRAAAQDDAQGQYQLGWMYEKGLGVAPNRERAIELYRKSAAEGVNRAVERLKELNGP